MNIELKNKYFSIVVNSFGAEWNSWKQAETGQELLWQADPDVWPRHAPVLFPIVGELKEGKYYYKGREFEMGRHGFARDSEFVVVYQSDTKLVLALKWKNNTLEVYPFEFEFRVGFELKDKTVIQTFEVENPGKEDLLFSVGAHPAFKIIPDGSYSISLNAQRNAAISPLTTEGLLSKKRNKLPFPLRIEKGTFNHDALVIANFTGGEIKLSGPQHSIVVNTAAPGLGIWAKPGAEFVCIEPWWGHADYEDHNGELKEKAGIVTLVPNGVFEGVVRFAISRPIPH